jgi:(S)-3,5-dihydroxyphenylglycine transaminase
LSVAERYGLLLLEDNPYGAFSYDAPSLPTLKALDAKRSVVYLGSFAKTLFPGLRVGYLVSDQTATGGHGSVARAMTTVKSLTTVNTATITQAMVGAALLEHDGSLKPVVSARLPHYRANRDRIISALSRNFGTVDGATPLVRWSHPRGGFFLVLTLPFDFGTEQLERSAADFGVIVSPMTYFSLCAGRERQVRLSFSYVDGPAIDEGVERLSRFVWDEVTRVGRVRR